MFRDLGCRAKGLRVLDIVFRAQGLRLGQGQVWDFGKVSNKPWEFQKLRGTLSAPRYYNHVFTGTPKP